MTVAEKVMEHSVWLKYNSYLCQITSRRKRVSLCFSERIKELRIQNQTPQRQLATALDIDIATYCKIEKGERRVKREQVENDC